MMSFKEKAHSVLESVVYLSAKTGQGRETIITIPCFELAKEVGFGQKAPGFSMRLTLRAEFIDEDDELHSDLGPEETN